MDRKVFVFREIVRSAGSCKLTNFLLISFFFHFQSMAEEALEAVSKNRKSHLNIDNVSQTGSQSSLALSEASQGKSIK